MLIWRLIQNNKPLLDNKNFFNITKYLILTVGIILTIADYTLLIAFLFSEYKEYLIYMETSILFSLGIIFLHWSSVKEFCSMNYLKKDCRITRF